MLDNASKAFFHLLARSATLKKIASRYGMRRPSSFARRFIAGETVEEAIEAARQVEASGLLQTTQQLGGAVGVAAIVSVYATGAEPGRFVPGVQAAFLTSAAFSLAAFLVAAALLRPRPAPFDTTAAEPESRRGPELAEAA